MSTKKVNSITKYQELISKSPEERSKELIEIDVLQAKNSLEQGILSIKGSVLKSQGEVKEAEIQVSKQNSKLLDLIGARPFNAQNILNARTAVQQKEVDLEAKKDELKQIESALEFLESLKTEYFS